MFVPALRQNPQTGRSKKQRCGKHSDSPNRELGTSQSHAGEHESRATIAKTRVWQVFRLLSWIGNSNSSSKDMEVIVVFVSTVARDGQNDIGLVSQCLGVGLGNIYMGNFHHNFS